MECSDTNKGKKNIHLGQSERESFVKTVLRLMEKGQYSKNDDLTNTVTTAVSILSYVEPSLILPFISSRFHLAVETVSVSLIVLPTQRDNSVHHSVLYFIFHGRSWKKEKIICHYCPWLVGNVFFSLMYLLFMNRQQQYTNWLLLSHQWQLQAVLSFFTLRQLTQLILRNSTTLSKSFWLLLWSHWMLMIHLKLVVQWNWFALYSPTWVLSLSNYKVCLLQLEKLCINCH